MLLVNPVFLFTRICRILNVQGFEGSDVVSRKRTTANSREAIVETHDLQLRYTRIKVEQGSVRTNLRVFYDSIMVADVGFFIRIYLVQVGNYHEIGVVNGFVSGISLRKLWYVGKETVGTLLYGVLRVELTICKLGGHLLIIFIIDIILI